MNSQRWFCLTILLIISCFSNSYAQNLSGRFGLGVFGAGVKMVGGDIDRSTIDQWAGFRIKYGHTPALALDLNVGCGWVYPRDTENSQFSSDGGFKTVLLPFNTNLIIHLLPKVKQRPFISFGIGLTQWDIRKLSGNVSAFSMGESVNGSKLSATILAGLGFEFFVTNDITAELCLKYHQLLKDNEDTIGYGDDANDGIVELRLSFAYFWGGFKDSDKDGIEDKYDLDKNNPEDIDGFKDHDGILDPDNDEDGILDRLDKAPNKPEDLDGFQDLDGVPDPDNDGDGILDKNDNCPNTKEDMDGFEDNDGCPEYDNDNDSIPDSLDQCPNWPEDFNGYMDHDGCPDNKPESPPVKKTEPPPYNISENIMLKGVNFASNSSQLTIDSYSVLNEIIKVLLKFPAIEIELCGYTDSLGDWNYNQQLSKKRAQAVKQYLINKGIAYFRIKAVGFGEENPIAPNTTKTGRAANRRIEFKRIK